MKPIWKEQGDLAAKGKALSLDAAQRDFQPMRV